MKSKTSPKIKESKIAQFRFERGLTQEELAKEVGVSCNAIRNWEHDRTGISPKKQLKLMRFFGVTREELFSYL